MGEIPTCGGRRRPGRRAVPADAAGRAGNPAPASRLVGFVGLSGDTAVAVAEVRAAQPDRLGESNSGIGDALLAWLPPMLGAPVPRRADDHRAVLRHPSGQSHRGLVSARACGRARRLASSSRAISSAAITCNPHAARFAVTGGGTPNATAVDPPVTRAHSRAVTPKGVPTDRSRARAMGPCGKPTGRDAHDWRVICARR